VLTNSLVPLAWHWDVFARVADAVRALGTLEALVADCRAWVALKNLRAVRAMRRATPPVEIEMPEELLAISMSPSQEWSSTDASNAMRVVASAISIAFPIGTVMGLVLEGFNILAGLIGVARGVWVDPWGRVEPVMEVPRLTGTLAATTEQTLAPTHEVEAAPRWSVEHVSRTRRGRSRTGGGDGNVGERVRQVRTAALKSTRSKSGATLGIGGTILYLLTR
jgi:hypothetical protein